MASIKCKVCRRLGTSICGREKCAFKRKPYPPGKLQSEKKHRSMMTEYGKQLIEKQKIRHTYGLREKQFAGYVMKAREAGGNPIETLHESLETRLDNVAYRLGFANSRALARQMVSHGHVTVNGRKVTIPSYRVAEGNVVAIREGSKATKLAGALQNTITKHKTPEWLSLDPVSLSGKVTGKPARNTTDFVFDYPAVVELYARS